MKRGFTLMEILAVILVIAVVASFAVPVYSAIRAEVRHQKAQSAGLKMGEAIRAFYQDSKGFLIYPPAGSTGMTGAQIAALADGTCQNPASYGIPSAYLSEATPDMRQLFYCGYLSKKDFIGLPYTFIPNTTDPHEGILLTVTGTDDAGRKYAGHSFTVLRDSSIDDVE